MKTTFVFTALTFCIFTSCRKNYVCECTNLDGDVYLHTLEAKMKESKAQQQCDLTELLYCELDCQCVAKEL